MNTKNRHRCFSPMRLMINSYQQKTEAFPHHHRRVLRKAEKSFSPNVKIRGILGSCDARESRLSSTKLRMIRECRESLNHVDIEDQLVQHEIMRGAYGKSEEDPTISLSQLASLSTRFLFTIFQGEKFMLDKFFAAMEKVCVSHILLALFDAIPVDFSHFPLSLSHARCCSPHATRMEPT